MVNRTPNPMQFVLHQLTSPLLSPIQRILPNTGMIDFSPMILVFGLFFLDKVLLDLFGAYWLLASY
ncbi:YggT family protein [Pasteurella canis]|uniref:YggT family protein n=1 Tax=Pasteurella canis TaxID=753 RepID=UPI001CD0B1FB|nr:YggT family protein [Pasteurella canis]